MIRVDSSEKICIDNRGMRTAEHLLLARYFDYQQVSYHKTVQGFERLLEDVLQVLVTDGLLDCSVQRLEEMAKNPFEWAAFDDASVTYQIREYAREHPETDDGLKARALVTRSGPKQVYSTEFFSEREANRQSLADKKALLKLAAEGVAAELAFPQSRYWIWDNKGQVITSIGNRVAASHLKSIDAKEAEGLELGVRILLPDRDEPVQLAECDHSIASVLSNYSLAILRLYVLLAPGEEDKLDQS